MMHSNSDRRGVLVSMLAPFTTRSACATEPACEPDRARNILSAYADAWRRGDTAALVAAYHEDFTLFYPGRHALSGVHRGRAAALQILQEVARRTRRELVSVLDIMTGGSEGALHVTERWTRPNGEVIVERLFVYTVRDERPFECRLFDADQTIVEEFLGRAP